MLPFSSPKNQLKSYPRVTVIRHLPISSKCVILEKNANAFVYLMKIVNLLSQGTRIHLDQIFALVQKYKILTQCRGNRAHVKKRKRA